MNTLSELCNGFFDKMDFDTDQTKEAAASDELCFRNAIKTFLRSGRKEDAFVVYFCFSEIFKLFGSGYDNTKRLLETLSDHEYHSGELLAKHRDHYSHSVYVFAIGLAIYAHDGAFRKSFTDFYGAADDSKTAFRFLRLWGMTSLFHDIGYPLQLAHEQIKTYSQELWGEDYEHNLFVSYGNLDGFLAIPDDKKAALKESLGCDREFGNINELLAYGLKLHEGYDEQAVCEKLVSRVEKQPYFMDHGYFGSVILAKQLLAANGVSIDKDRLDTLTAILLHNSFNKYDAPDRHPISPSEHPLAYLLIVCDELQCWDRLAYGKISKRDPIAWDIALDIGDNKITAKYLFDHCTIVDGKNMIRLNKSVEAIQNGKFVRDILVGTEKRPPFVRSDLQLTVTAEEKNKKRRAHLYASDDSFINLCDFAKAIHISYNDCCRELSASDIEQQFGELPLEFKVSNIEQAKSYAHKLELINCFYSSKDLDYPVVEDFRTADFGTSNSDTFGFLCREEHVRWVKEKLALGWRYGVEGVDYKTREERNMKKLNKCIVPYECLSADDKAKDSVMIDNIIPLLKKLGNNIRIYNYRYGRKPDLVVGGVGHRYYKEDPEKLKEKIKRILASFNETYRVVVLTSYAYGADQLIAECATEMGITTKAALPMPYDEFIRYVREDAQQNKRMYTAGDEDRLRGLLAQTVVCKTIENTSGDRFTSAAQYIIGKSQRLIALWDGEEMPLYDEHDKPINRGGTYHCIQMARSRFSNPNDLYIVHCSR